MANQNQFVSDLITARLETLCTEGHFPEIGFKHENHFKSYSLMEWCETRAKVAKMVHDQLVATGYEQGIWATRLRSKAFQDKTSEIVAGITAEGIKTQTVRFRTWMD